MLQRINTPSVYPGPPNHHCWMGGGTGGRCQGRRKCIALGRISSSGRVHASDGVQAPRRIFRHWGGNLPPLPRPVPNAVSGGEGGGGGVLTNTELTAKLAHFSPGVLTLGCPRQTRLAAVATARPVGRGGRQPPKVQLGVSRGTRVIVPPCRGWRGATRASSTSSTRRATST
jgi:hypothetical protein